MADESLDSSRAGADPHEIRRINWREVFGFTHIFKSFRLSRHMTKMVIAVLAVIVGLSLFADDQEAERDRLAERLSVERERRTLLPKAARRSRVSASGVDGGKGVVDDF